MQLGIVAGDGERGGVGMAADHRDLGAGRNARGLGHARRLAGEARRLAREHHLDAAVMGEGAGGERHRALERIERCLFASLQSHDQLKATFAVDCGRSSPKARW